MQQWTPYFNAQLPEILQELQNYVELESPTDNKATVDLLCDYVSAKFQTLGCSVRRISQSNCGDQLVVEFGEGDEQVLVLGHLDTVKPIGALVKEPWHIEDGRAFGPGVYDMKAGVVFAYFALQAIIAQSMPLKKRIVFFWNTDEETGSPSSRRHIEEEAKHSVAALIMEPAHPTGALKTSRKSSGEFTIRVHGKAAHAGNDHAAGINAIEELARQIVTVQSWTDYEKGTTVSVGRIQGGSAVNVVPDFAEAVIDARITNKLEGERLKEQFAQLKPVARGARIEVMGGFEKEPMVRTALTAKLFELAESQAKAEGFSLTEVAAGGSSDGNYTSAVGTPTLDGLGPVGDGAHALGEHILIEEIPKRIAMLFRLLTNLAI